MLFLTVIFVTVPMPGRVATLMATPQLLYAGWNAPYGVRMSANELF